MRKKRVSITDLAKELKLSPSTVSRALRDEQSISLQTREKVAQLAREKGYRPNALARSLLTHRTHTIGLVVPDFIHPFFATVMAGAESVFTDSGFQIIACTSDSRSDKEQKVVELLLNTRVDGLLISFASDTKNFSHFQQIQSEGIPIVFLDRVAEELEACSVITDDFQGARLAGEFLIEAGCNRIGHIKGPEHISPTFQRFIGYRETLRQHGREVDPELLFQSEDDQGGHILEVDRLLEALKVMDGLFVFNDYIAYKVMQLCQTQGVRIPEDLKIIGFGNDPFGVYMRPPLPTIDQQAFKMGATAARILLNQIYSDPAHYEPQTHILPTHLISRKE